MLLAGPRPSTGGALPPSERNYARGRPSRWRDPHRVSEAAGGGAETAETTTPHRLRPRPGSNGPRYPAAATSGLLTVVLRTNAASVPKTKPGRSSSGPSRKTVALEPGLRPGRLAAPHARTHSSSGVGPGGSLGKRGSGLRGAEGFEERKGPQWVSTLTVRSAAPSRPPAPTCPAAPANRRPRGLAGGDGVLSRTAHVPQSGRQRRWFPAARCARR